MSPHYPKARMTAFTLTLSMLMAFMLSAFHLAARYAQADTGGDAQVNRELINFLWHK